MLCRTFVVMAPGTPGAVDQSPEVIFSRSWASVWASSRGDVHLRHPDPVGDLGLGHVAEEPQHEDGALALGELVEQRAQRLAVLDVLQLRVDRPQGVGERGLRAGHQLVEGAAAVGLLGVEPLDDVGDRHVQARGDLAGPRRPAQLLGQRADRSADRGLQVLEPARHAHRPGAVAEVAPDLPVMVGTA
jgi:hypothetical protein